jgi:hypothetical protein
MVVMEVISTERVDIARQAFVAGNVVAPDATDDEPAAIGSSDAETAS